MFTSLIKIKQCLQKVSLPRRLLTTEVISSPQRCVLLDGNNVIYNGYDPKSTLTRKTDDQPIGVAVEFTKFLLRMLYKFDPDYMILVFDTPSRLIKSERLGTYKKKRTPTPLSLRSQFSICKKIAQEIFNISVISEPGIEADDILATYATLFSKQQHSEVTIVSNDKDFLQLVKDPPLIENKEEMNHLQNNIYPSSIQVYSSYRKKILREKQVASRFGSLKPCQLPDLFSLVGDVSDDIEGIPNLSFKKAIDLILRFDGLHSMLRQLEDIEDKELRIQLKKNISRLQIAYEIIQLNSSLFQLNTEKMNTLKAPSILSQFQSKCESFLGEEGYHKVLEEWKNIQKFQDHHTRCLIEL